MELEKDISRYLEILANEPNNREAIASLKKLYAESKDWQNVAELINREAELESIPEEKAEFFFQAGQIWEDQVGRLDMALVGYQQAFKASSTCVKALSAARRIYTHAEKYSMVARLLDLELQMTRDAEQGLSILIELGDVLAQKLDMEDKARECYLRASQIEPENLAIQRRLEDLDIQKLPSDERWAILQERASASSDPSLAANDLALVAQEMFNAGIDGGQVTDLVRHCLSLDANQAVAMALAEMIGLQEEAAEPHVAEAISETRELEVTLENEEDLLGGEPLSTEAQRDYQDTSLAVDVELGVAEEALTESVETLTAEDSAVEEMSPLIEETPADYYDETLHIEDETSVSPEEAAPAEEAQELPEEEAAPDEEALVLADEEAPLLEEDQALVEEEVPPLEEAQELPEEEAAPDEEALVLADEEAPAEEEVPPPEPQMDPDLMMAIQKINEGLIMESVPHFMEAFRRDRLEAMAHEEVIQAYGEGVFDQFLEEWEKQSRQATGSPEELGVLLDLGVVCWKGLEDVDKADRYFKKAARLQAEDPVSLLFYKDFFAAKQNWKRLMDILVSLSKETDETAAKVDAGTVLASIAEDQAGNNEKAIDAWRQVLYLQNDHQDAKANLKRLYLKTEKWNAYLEFLKEEVDQIPNESVEEKVAAYQRMLEIYRDKLKLDVMVVNTYNSILTIAPGNREALDALIEKYESMKRYADLVGVLQRKAETLSDPVELVDIHMQIARLFLDRFSNQAEAIKAFENVLEVNPRNEEAISRLKEMYTRRRDWERLIKVTSKEVDLRPTVEERIQGHLEIAEMASDKIKRPPLCIELWQKVLEQDSHNAQALDALSKLYEREKLWVELADILTRQVDIAADPAAQGELLTNLAMLQGDRIGDAHGAIATWQRLLQIDPENRKAQDQLKRKYIEVQAWDDLEGFFAALDGWEEYVHIMERQVGLEEEPATKVMLLFRAALVWSSRLDQLGRATLCYENVLAIEPENLQAAGVLEPLYLEGEQWEKLIHVLEIQLGHLEDGQERLALIRRIADLNEEKLQQNDKAFDWQVQAFMTDIMDLRSRADLERLTTVTGRFEELIAAYLEAMGLIESPPVTLPLRIEVARVQDEELGRYDEALESYKAILAIEEHEPHTMEALEKLYAKMERWDDLLALLDEKLELAGEDMDQRREILNRIAFVWEEMLERPEKAIGIYEQVLETDENNLDALAALGRIYRGQGMWDDTANILLKQLSIVQEGEHAVEARFQLGLLNQIHLDDKAKAVSYFREVLEEDPSHERAREALEDLIQEEDLEREVASILAPIYEQVEMWPQLVSALEILAKHAEESSHKVDLLLKIGSIQSHQLASAEAAFEAFGRAYRLDPSCDEARADLEHIALAMEGWDNLVTLYQEPLDSIEDGDLAKEISLKIAQIYEESLDNPPKAQEFYRRAMTLAPEEYTAIDALERLYTQGSQWAELQEIYRRKVEMAPQQEDKEAILFQIANVWEEMLNNPQEAIATYKEILDLDENNLKALKAYDRLLVSQENWFDLANVLQRQLILAEEPEDQIALKCRLAELQENKLQDLTAAVEIYRSVLDMESSNETALLALEILIEHPDHKFNISNILEPLYREAAEGEKLIQVYEIQIEFTQEVEARVDLLHRIGHIYDELLADDDKAFITYARAFHEDPGREETIVALEQLAVRRDGWEELAQVFENEAEQIDEAGLAADIHMKLARLYEIQLADPERAQIHYRQVLTFRRDNMEALEALERLFTELDRWDDLARITLIKAKAVRPDASAEEELLKKACYIYEEQLGDQRKAIAVCRRMLRLDESSDWAMSSLERLYLQIERWTDLVSVYRKRISLTYEPDRRKELLSTVGRIYEESLEDRGAAIETYREILDMDPEDLTAVQALDRLYEAEARWQDLLEILEREYTLVDSSMEQVEIRFRIGQLWERELGDLVRAIECYRDILAMVPNHEATLQALERLLMEGDERLLASQVLEPIYEEFAEWEKLVEVYEVQNQMSDDPPHRIELLHKIAEIQERQLEDRQTAFLSFGRALKEDPANTETLEALERLAGIMNTWEEAIGLYEEQLKEMDDPVLAVDMCLRMARLHELATMDFDRAIAKLRQVLAFDPHHEGAIASLDNLFTQEERWADLAEILELEIRYADDPERRIELLYRLGEIRRQQLANKEGAIECYREVLEVDPDHDATIAALESLVSDEAHLLEVGQILAPLYTRNDEWEKLINLHEYRIAVLAEQEERVQVMQHIAELAEDKLGQKELAFSWHSQAFREDPSHEATRGQLERLAHETVAWEELIGLYLDHVDTLENRDLAKELCIRVAQIYEEKLYDEEKGEICYRKSLDIDPADETSLVALDRIYLTDEKWPELANILRAEIKACEDDDDRIQFIFRLGQLLEHQLEDVDGAVEGYKQVLMLDGGHAPSLRSLENIYLQSDQWKELYAIYEQELDIVEGDSARAGILAKMAELAQEQLNDPEDAIRLWGEVLNIKGEDITALMALEHLYEQEERWRELVDVCERQVAITLEEDRQIELYSKLGKVWGEELGRDQNALEKWQKVTLLDPENRLALYALKDIYQKTEAWEELVDTLHRLIEILEIMQEDEEELRSLFVQLGQVQGDLLMRPLESIEAWRKVMELNDTDAEAIANLERLYSQEEDWSACVNILKIKVELIEEPQEKIDVLLLIADIWENKAYQPEEAIPFYEQILELDPSHMDASRSLEALYRSTERWERLVELLLQRLEYTEDKEDRIETFHQMAQVYEGELMRSDFAFVILSQAFGEDMGNERTNGELERVARSLENWTELIQLFEDALTTIADRNLAISTANKVARWYAEELEDYERAMAYYQRVLAIDAANLEALIALEAIYRHMGKWDELIKVLNITVGLSDAPEDKKAIYFKIAELYETMVMDTPQAIAAYKAAMKLDDSDEVALSALERLYQQESKWRDLVEILNRKAAVAFDDREIIILKERVGNLWEDELNVPDRAIDAFKEILNVDQTNRTALLALERLYNRKERWNELLDIYDLQMLVADSDDDRIEIYHNMAGIWDGKFNKGEEASEFHQKVLMLDPNNLESIEALERIYRAVQRWDDLVETYQRHVEALREVDKQVTIYSTMGQVFEQQIGDVYRSIDAYRRMLDLDPSNTHALESLSRLYEDNAEWEACIDALGQLAHLVDSPEQQVALYFRMGRHYEENIQDLGQAEEKYKNALDADPGHLPAIQALKEIYKDKADWSQTVEMLDQEVEYTDDPAAKTALLFEIGQIYQDQLEDKDSAVRYFQRTIDLDPNHVGAASPLVEVYYAKEQWDLVEPILDMLVRALSRSRDVRDIHLLHHRLAVVSEHLDNLDKAAKHYRLSYEIDSTYLPTLERMADLLYRRQDWDKAFKIYQTILVHHRDTQSDDGVVEIFYRLGNIKLALAERKKALSMYEKALEVKASHRPTLEACIEIHDKANQLEQVINYKRQILELCADSEDEKFALLVEIGNLWLAKQKDYKAAEASWNEALELQPQNRDLLHRLLTLFTESKQWAKAVEILVRITDLEKDTEKLARFFYTIGVIYRDEIQTPEEAIEYFNRALDAAPAYLKAFEAIDRICTERRDWPTLEKGYRRMIKRVPNDGSRELKVMLWRNLGEIYRTRLHSLDNAVAAFEVASSLAPDDYQLYEILAEILETKEESWPKAVSIHHIILRESPYKVRSYKSLFRLYTRLQLWDQAYCTAQVLRLLREAGQEEEAFVQRYRPKTLPKSRRKIDNELWNNVMHPDQSPFINGLYGLIADYMAAFSPANLKALNIKKKDRQDLSEPLMFCKVFNYVSQVLGVRQPVVYHKPDLMGITLYNTVPQPSMVVGGDMFKERQDKELAFILAKNLTYMRMESYLCRIFPDVGTLRSIFLAAVNVSFPNFPINGNLAEIEVVAKHMVKNVPPPVLAQLGQLVKRIFDSKTDLNLNRWVEATEHTANRVAMLICGDLDVAAKCLQEESMGIGQTTVKEKLQDLFLYTISDEYASIRKTLGLTVTGE